MIIKVVKNDLRLNGIDEIVYEISINDAQHYYMRKSVYDKINDGIYYILLDCGNLSVYDKDRNLIEKITDTVY